MENNKNPKQDQDSVDSMFNKVNMINIRDDTSVIAVLGTGRYGRALTNRLTHAGYDVRVGSRTPSEHQYSLNDAVSAASIVFLCVPAFAHDSLVQFSSQSFNPGTILVDISNHGLAAPPRRDDPSIAERLEKIVPENVIVAKALNTIAAETIEKDALTTIAPPLAKIACNERDSARKLAEVMTDISLAPIIVGPLSMARQLEQLAHRQFPLWHIPSYVSVIVFVFWLVYYSLYQYVGLIPSTDGNEQTPIREDANDLPMAMLIHPMAETGMTLFALTFMAGPIATLIQLFRGSGSKTYWKWLTIWLNMRKELGLIALGFIVAHAIAGITETPRSISALDRNLFYSFGILSFFVFLLVSVNSSPDVAAGLSWREARAVFSWFGLLAFILGAGHQVIYAYYIDDRDTYPTIGSLRLLSTGWLGFIIVAIAILLRVIVWSPFVVYPIRRLNYDKRFETAL